MAAAFLNDAIDKQFHIDSTDNTISITNDDIEQDGFKLTESISSDVNFRFGNCEGSQLNVELIDNGTVPNCAGKTFVVTIVANGDTFTVGTFKCVNDNLLYDDQTRTLVMYDALAEVLNKDFTTFYNTEFPTSATTKTLKTFRDNFFTECGITQETRTLVNDSMVLTKGISGTITGATILQAICEINGVFGHINRSGKFDYIGLPTSIEMLTPAETLTPSATLTPGIKLGAGQTVPNSAIYDDYFAYSYERYTVHKVDKLVIRTESDDVGATSGTGNNAYIVEGNFLTFGLTAANLQTVCNNLYRTSPRINVH